MIRDFKKITLAKINGLIVEDINKDLLRHDTFPLSAKIIDLLGL